MVLLLGYGFLGKAIYSCLKTHNIEVKVISRNFPATNSDFIVGDVLHIESLIDNFEGVDTVIHCLHSTVPSTSFGNEKFDVESNVLSMITILDICKLKEVKKFVYISSGGAVYGKPISSMKIKESSVTNPISSYGITKLVCEKFVLLNKDYFKKGCFIIRPSNIYGVGQSMIKPQGIIGHAIHACKNDRQLQLWGTGLGKKDYLHIDDFCSAILKLLGSNVSLDDNLFNLGSNEILTVVQIIKAVEKKYHKTLDIEYIEQKKFDVESIILDCNKFRETFGWRPMIKFKDFLNSNE